MTVVVETHGYGEGSEGSEGSERPEGSEVTDATWVDICSLNDLVLNWGVCALVGDTQVALFRVSPDGSLYALSNYDPFSKAFVLSRGIVGSAGSVIKVASPVFKQGFDLRTGQCLEDPSVTVPTYPVRVVDGRVQIGRR